VISVNVINAQEKSESAESLLSAFIIEYITNNVSAFHSFDDLFESSWFSARNEILNLFLEVFNNRHNVNIKLGDPDDYNLQRKLRGEAFRLLNDTIHFTEAGGVSDGQDSREVIFRDTISFMILGLLSPNSVYQSRFFDIAKSINLGDTWYSFPRQYTVVVLLEILLEFERVQENQWLRRNPRFLLAEHEKIVTKLKELNIYLTDIIESGQHDIGALIEEDIIFINRIIQIISQDK